MKHAVLDTNVVVAALRSQLGASYRVLRLAGEGRFRVHLSVALVLEYESALKRHHEEIGLTARQIDDVLDYLCQVGVHEKVHFLWRPALKDPGDDMVLELAVASGATIVTFNKADFGAAPRFGANVQSPQEFLKNLKEAK